MSNNMPATDGQKKGNRRMRFVATGEVQLDRRGREIFARLERKTKRIYKISNGELRPWRVLLRCLKDAQDAENSLDELDAMLRDLTAEIREILLKRRGGGVAA